MGSESDASVLNDLIVQHNTLVDDMELLRTVSSGGATIAVTELMTDHATTKVTVDQMETLIEELGTDHGTAVTWMTEVDGDENNINNQIDYLLTPDGVIGGSHAFSAGAAVTLAATGWVKYRISGVEYTAEMPATVTLQDLGDVTQNNFSAWRIEIDALGAVTAKASPTVGGYGTAQIALLALGGLAPTASAVTLGYLTLTDSDSVINIGTDNLNAAGVTSAIYYERGPRKRITGLNTAQGAVSTLTAASTTYGVGNTNINVNGLKKAQIAAAAAQALTDADTVTTLTFGNILLLTDLAGTGFVTLNGAGTPGATLQAHATAAAALVASDLVVDRLPPMFVPIALIKISAGDQAPFTVKTTNWTGAGSSVCTITDAAVAGWNRTVSTGFNSHQIGRVAIPADITAPLVASLSASISITAGPATLSAPVPSSTAVDTAGDLLGAKIGDSSGVAIAASS